MAEEEQAASAKATASQEELKKQLEESEKKASEYLAGWQRARADFLNYKKEEMERISEFLKYASEEFILKILPILDNFEIAEKKLPENLKADELCSSPPFADARVKDEKPEVQPSVDYGASIKGFLQIKRQLENFLKSQGVEEIKSVGEKFDPNFHEVVEEIEVKDKEKGIVIEEILKGYKINGRLLRPTKVKVSK